MGTVLFVGPIEQLIICYTLNMSGDT